MAYAKYTLAEQPSDGRYIYDVPFPYLSKDHVYCQLNDNTGIFETLEWLDDQTVEIITEELPLGTVIHIKRKTPRDKLLFNFQDGQLLTGKALNQSYLQMLYSAEELSINGVDTSHVDTIGYDIRWENILNAPGHVEEDGVTMLSPGSILLYGGDTLDNINADHVPESTGKKWAGQSGADVTSQNTANDVRVANFKVHTDTQEEWEEGTLTNLSASGDNLSIGMI